METNTTIDVNEIEVADEVEAWLASLGRKVVDTDITFTLRRLATEYAASYTGDWAFMRDMRRAATRPQTVRRRGQVVARAAAAPLSTGQARGVLNVWRAAVERANRQATSAPAQVSTPEPGYYTDDEGRIYRVQPNQARTSVYAKVRVGGDGWEYVGRAWTRVEGWRPLDEATAAAFGHAFGICGICGATLTDPESGGGGRFAPRGLFRFPC